MSVPIGSILPFAGPANQIPSNDFLPCDGRPLEINHHKRLYDVIGTNWGGDAAEGHFKLPDLNGRFLRGVDHGCGRDPDAQSRTESGPGGATKDNVGSAQDWATAHPHSKFGGTTNGGGSNNPMGEKTGHPAGTNPANGLGYNVPNAHLHNQHTHGFVVTSGGDNETRPQNVYVNWIIRVDDASVT
jgi:microcystin-dependent protein